MIPGERLKDRCPALKNRVQGAAAMAAATPESLLTPCVFVIPLTEKADDNAGPGGNVQRCTAQVGVVIAVKNAKDAHGEHGHRALGALRAEIRAALCGWQATDAITPVRFVQGQLAGYDNLTLRWSDVFAAVYYLKAGENT